MTVQQYKDLHVIPTHSQNVLTTAISIGAILKPGIYPIRSIYLFYQKAGKCKHRDCNQIN